MAELSTRTYYVRVSGFEFGGMYIRAATRSRARYLCAAMFKDAGYGTVVEGLRHVESCRLAPDADAWPLLRPDQGEGLVVEREAG